MQQKVMTMPSMDATFVRWTALTDAYAEQLAAMARGEPAARAEAARLSHEIRGMHDAPTAAPPSQTWC